MIHYLPSGSNNENLTKYYFGGQTKLHLKLSHFYWSSIQHARNNANYNRFEISENGSFTFANNNHVSSSEWGPIVVVPLLATLVLAISVFLLVVFRQNPTFVITTVAACIVFIVVYLALAAMDGTPATFE